jgi:hypothetical protein
VFRERFLTSEYIWAYRYDVPNEHSHKSYYIECDDPIEVFDLTTNEGANHFRSVLRGLPDPTLIDLFEDKIVNLRDLNAGKAEKPRYASRSSREDKKLADGLAFYRETHKVDGWVLQLGSNQSEEFLFLYPSVYFSSHEFLPKRR